MNMLTNSVVMVLLALATTFAFGQQAGASAPSEPAAAPAKKFKSALLNRAQLDALLAKPEELLIIDVRRPDELAAKGGFPVYLSIQAKELEKYAAFIPRDRTIVTVSNHAGRAGPAADLLASKGFKVAGAVGADGYAEEGGTLLKVVPPPPRPAAAAPTPAPTN
jgi:rhodanese-related sulfurtransferase